MAQAVMVAEPQVVAEIGIAISTVKIDETHKKNRIQVSNTKKPLFFYLNLAKRYIKQHNDVELSALGMAIPTAVTIAEILKSSGVAVEKRVLTSTVGSKDENKGRLVQKAKLEILLEKNEKNQKTSDVEATNNISGNQKTSEEKIESKTETETQDAKKNEG